MYSKYCFTGTRISRHVCVSCVVNNWDSIVKLNVLLLWILIPVVDYKLELSTITLYLQFIAVLVDFNQN